MTESEHVKFVQLHDELDSWRAKAESYELDLIAERRDSLSKINALTRELGELQRAHDALYRDFEKARKKLAIIEIVVAKPPMKRQNFADDHLPEEA